MKRGVLSLLLALVVAVAAPLLAQNNPDTAVWTDKNNYVPGDIVTVTGMGFQPGEVVNLVFRVDGREDRTSTATADENGGFINTAFSPDGLDLDQTIKLIATGTTSGFEAVNYFLDGPNDPPSCDNGTNSFTVDGSVASSSGRVFKTIQEAITSLPDVGPCTVNIKAGIYNESVTISGENVNANSSQAVTIRRDPSAPFGTVIVKSIRTSGQNKNAIDISSSKFITVQGLKITEGKDAGVGIRGGSSDITIAANDLNGNTNGVTINSNQQQPRIYVVNNVIHNNSSDAVLVDMPNAARSFVVNNTIQSNGGRGIQVAGASSVALVTNLIVGNAGYGLQKTGGSNNPALHNNMFYANASGDIGGSVLDSSDSGNYVTLSSSAPGIIGCTFNDCLSTHALSEIVDATGHLASGSPAADKGLNSFVDGVQRVPAIDIDGDARPVNNTVDIGADERPLSDPPPAPVITGHPDDPTNQTTATFTFSESEATATLDCDIDNLGFTPCSSPKTYPGLADGSHTFTVRATNAAGSSTAQYMWLIDTASPSSSASVTAGTEGSNGWYKSDVTVTITASKNNGTIKQIVYSINSGSAVTVPGSTAVVNVTTEGSTTITFHSVDTVGNLEADNTFTVKIDKTAPTATLAITHGTQGSNGWYTSNVTLHATGTDANGVTCDEDFVVSDETAGQEYKLTCTDEAGWSTQTNGITIKLDKTGPSAEMAITAGTPGANGWYTSDVTIHTSGTDNISSPVTCTADQFQTAETTGTEFTGSCTNDAGLTTNASPFTVKLDKTAPTGVAVAVTAGTLGNNNWYTSDVTVTTSGNDSISGVTCTDIQTFSTETAGQEVSGTCTNGAGLKADATPITIKLDKTGPSAALAVSAGTPGANGWYVSDVTVHASGSDSISSPVTCTADQFQTTETTGTSFAGSCTNDAGLTTNATPLTVKVDKTAPAGVALAVTSGTLGNNGWYVSNVELTTSGLENISTPLTCTAVQSVTTDTTGATFNGQCTNDAGLTASAAALIIKRDATAPTLSPLVSPNPVVLNGSATASAGALDATSGIASSACNSLVLTSVGPKTVSCNATDNAGNTASASATYSVIYSPAGTACLGDLGHTILQPVDADGSSVFKQKSTVPAKFRVCDATGASIGSAGVVTSFRLIGTIAGTVSQTVDEAVVSTTPDANFRWDPMAAQWIFNMNTKNLVANTTYLYRVTLNDGTPIDFRFGLK